MTTTSTSTRTAAARAVGATKIYGYGDTAVRAIDGIDVEFFAGEFTAVMGASGSVKSTLMHCMAGLDELTSGSVYIDQTELGSLSRRQLTLLRRDRVGFIFQAFNLIPTLTARENMTLPQLLAGEAVDEEWLKTVVDHVDLADRMSHRPNELSGGQQQRVAVARTLASRPYIIFADEPTGNLDSRSGHQILDFMRMAVDQYGQTIIMVTHDPNAASYADRVVFLADGHIVDDISDPDVDAIIDRIKSLDA